MAKYYTKCVAPLDYKEPDFSIEEFVAKLSLLAGIMTIPEFGVGLIPALWAAMSALLKICDYLLNGKLVCLGDGGEECAIGHVINFETVDDKPLHEKIDNDFSINILLAPHSVYEFNKGGTRHDNYFAVAEDGIQGQLIKEQPFMPKPMNGPHIPNQDGPISPHYGAYTGDWVEPAVHPSWVKQWPVPVLHCEIEGDRIYYVCKTLETLSNPIPGFCRWKPLGIPIGHVICSIMATLMAPYILAALVAAWYAGADDNREDFAADSLAEGDLILVRGRWVFDAGHGGYNELHPVLYLQKLDDSSFYYDPQYFKDVLLDRWCPQTAQTPPPLDPGEKNASLTPAQTAIFNNQRRPENRWLFHPLIDGCQPAQENGGHEPPH